MTGDQHSLELPCCHRWKGQSQNYSQIRRLNRFAITTRDTPPQSPRRYKSIRKPFFDSLLPKVIMSEAEAVQNPTEPVAPVEAPVEEKAIEQPEATEVAETKETKETEEIKEETEAVEAAETKETETKETEETEKKNGANILKTTAKIDRDNASNNRKFDPSVRQVTDDPEEIRKQVRKRSKPHS